MGKTFISYRRKDWAFAQKIAESLESKIKNGSVFIDVKGVSGRAEADFQRIITKEIEECALFVLIVTDRTFEETRINQEDDWLRKEISLALQLNKPIALAIFERTEMPRPAQLPANVQDISRMHGINFFPDYFDKGMTDFLKHCSSIAPQAFELRKASDHPTSVAMREQTGIVATFANLEACKDSMIADFEKCVNARLLLQIGRKEMGGGVASYFFEPAKKKRTSNASIRVLHASKESPFLSRERAQMRSQSIGEDDEEPATTADEWYDGLDDLQKRIQHIKTRGVNIERREHHEPYLWRIFLFDDIAYVSGYFYRRENDGKGGVHKIIHSPNSLFEIFDSYFEYLWKKYDPSEVDLDPNEKWKYWGC